MRCLHSDTQLLVFDKPSGLLTVPGRGADKQDCLAHRAQAQWPDALVVHRLDMATSGLVVMARGKAAQRRLSEAFASRLVYKRYVAVVDGCPSPVTGEIDLPLIADWPNRPRQKVDHATGKPSLTRYAVVADALELGGCRVQLEPLTGRSHQLRVHLCEIGHPIVGDALYAPAGVAARSARLLLHAEVLALPHPLSGELVRFESPAGF